MISKPPFFIVGCSRSGTTLLQTLLDAHPNIAIPPESHIFDRFSEIFDTYGDLHQISHLRLLVKDLLRDERIKQWQLKTTVSAFCDELRDLSLRSVLSLLFELYARQQGKGHWGDKTPDHIMYLSEIKSLFPEAKFIHLIRDGRDVANSLLRVFFGPNTIDQAAYRWKRDVSAFWQFKKNLSPGDYLEIFYENLVAHPQEELKKILTFLEEDEKQLKGIPLQGSVKEHYIKLDSIHRSLKRPIFKRRIGIFRKRLDQRQIEIFESIAGDMLEAYGYKRVTSGKKGLRWDEAIRFGFLNFFLRVYRKMGKREFLKSKIQSGVRKVVRKIWRNKSFLFFLVGTAWLSFFCFLAPQKVDAAQVGIKYNRPKREYPDKVLKDFERFRDDRIRAIMIALPWRQWEPVKGQIDQTFIDPKLAPVLRFCAENQIRIIITSHCSFWGEKGDWTIPDWIKAMPDFKSSTSVLTSKLLRFYHISFLNRLIETTKDFPSVIGYNILNEPVAPTRYALRHARANFDARWEGVLEIAQRVKEYKTKNNIRQFLILGQHGSEPGYESYVWKHTGKYDLTPLWTQVLDKISAQWVATLIESEKWYPDRPKIRTEGALFYALLNEMNRTGKFESAKTKWSEDIDLRAVVYDYDSVYEYEGLANARVPHLEAFYAWRVGSPGGSSKYLTFFDHRNGDRPTPYYWALRDLASGVDSFETLAVDQLPKSGKGSLLFDPQTAKAGISKFWKGSGIIRGQKENLPPGTDSTIAARVVLNAGQSIFRSVISAHWKDNGVSAKDHFVFWGFGETKENLPLLFKVETNGKEYRIPISIIPAEWKQYRVSFKDLGILENDISFIQEIGFVNETKRGQQFLIDEFLLRE